MSDRDKYMKDLIEKNPPSGISSYFKETAYSEKMNNAFLKITSENRKLKAENERLREALEFYKINSGDCNRIGEDGKNARNRLAKDVGKKAEEALQAKPLVTEKNSQVLDSKV